MPGAFQTHQIAKFTLEKKWNDIPTQTVDQLKKHLLDSIGSLIHATTRPSIKKLFSQVKSMGEGGNCEIPVVGNTAFDRAAQVYTALIRYPDFMDNFLGKEATCHPSDNIGSLLAAAQLTGAGGKEFLVAMAIGYEIECRLIEEIPVMMKSFDHTVLLGYSLTAALSKMMKLTEEQTANALSIIGCSNNPLVTCRASYTWEWKGFASSLTALNCVQAVMLAKEGMTGPADLFEKKKKGFDDIFRMTLEYEWNKDKFDLIPKCILKGYNSEVHTQPAVEAALELQKAHNFLAENIEEIDVTTFLTCYHIVGGGEYGDRTEVFSKEQADHSLFYVIAVALLDGEVYPAQLLPERIRKDDVQQLLKKVKVHTSFPLHEPKIISGLLDKYTEKYPDKVCSEVKITLKDGAVIKLEKEDYKGFFTRPFTWNETVEKFKKLTSGVIDSSRRQEIIDVLFYFENMEVKKLCSLININ